MILKQYYLGCLAHASYLIGDEASSTAIIIDPQRDIQQYLADAEKFSLQIRSVFLTHFHADLSLGFRRALWRSPPWSSHKDRWYRG
jgi:hydroxyacylglutathione hydrolase